jgi:raffinose/stachyose/melibiose transport system substrate-binding protein
VPSVLAIVGVLHNQAIFSRLHLAIPTSLAAFEAACALTHAAGFIPLGLGNADGWVGDDWYLTLVNALAGPASLIPEQRLDPHFSFSGPSFTRAAATLQTWAGRQFFTPQFGGLDAQDGIAAFFQGKTAMALISSTENGQIVSLSAQTKIPVGVFAFPSADGKQAPVMPQSGYAGWAVPQASRQPALAESFITQMLSAATARVLLAHGLLPARQLSSGDVAGTQGFQRSYLRALATATPGVYLDGAPVPNLNATMEANVQLLLQRFETPSFLARSLQLVYSSGGLHASSTRTDGEF